MSAQTITRRPHKRNPAVRAAAGILLTALILIAAFALHSRRLSGSNSQQDDGKMAEDIRRLSEETYSAVLLSMHSTENFREEDFLLYRGLDTLVTGHSILNTKELSAYLECILASGNTVSDLYICPDPELLWTTAKQNTSIWKNNLEQDFCSPIESHPDISFSILLPYPSIDYWLELNSKTLDKLLTIYHTLINELYVYPNVRIFFPGAEEWLTLNPDNYTDTLFDANEIITRSIFLHTFCDGNYIVTPENEESIWTMLRETIAREKVTPTRRCGLSDYCIVFFGDSVLGNYPGSFSIPGYVTGLSDAVTFNYAVGGTSASSFLEDGPSDFPNLIDGFLMENTVLSGDSLRFAPPSSTAEELADKKLCFLISYGFNDYFNGAPVENPQDPYDIRSFKGGLRTCIGKLQSAFPDACCILMTPTHTGAFHHGTDITSEHGEAFPSYIHAIAEIAEETGSFLIDNYNGSVITQDNLDVYLADGVHPNETGRLAIADRIIRFMEQEINLPEQKGQIP